MAETRWMQHVERSVGALAARSHRGPRTALLLAAVLTGLGLFSARVLSLDADLTDLLPRTFRSVQDIDLLKERFGGIGYVVVVGQGAPPEALRRFADDFVPKLEALPGIRFVDYKRASQFFEDRALYYLDLDDLEEVRARIDARQAWERQQQNPMFIDLEGSPAPSLDFSDIENKHGVRSDKRLAGNGEVYYLDPKEQIITLLAKPLGTSVDLAYSKKVVAEVEELLAKQDWSAYGPNFHVALTGTFKKKLDQQKQIVDDITVASSIAAILLLVYLLFHFRSALAVALSLSPVFAGLSWTYGIVGVGYGTVNLLTGFLGAILGGLGIEHGIHLLGRYQALRAEGYSSEDATREAFTHTGGSALISSVVAALTFLSLALSEFRAFREFGVIAAIGMIVTVGAYVLVLPPMLGLASRFGWRPAAEAAVTGRDSFLARWLPTAYRGVAAFVGLFMLGLILNVPQIRFNYDFAALEDASLPSFQLDHQVNRILGYSQTPVVVLTEKPETERAVVTELTARKQRLGAQSTIDFVAALDDLVPVKQTEKREKMREISALLDKVSPKRLEPAAREQLERAQRMVRAEPFVRADLPTSVRRQFEGIGASQSGFVLVFPSISLSDGAKVRSFGKEVREISLPGGEQVSAAGEAMVLADILEMVTREAPPVLCAAVLSIVLAMWITLGSLRVAFVCLLPTVVSLLALIGLMPIIGLRFNYLNIVIVPILIGVTVDAGVHLLSRLSDAQGDFTQIYGETGRAICGGLLTSAVGFGVLLWADHPGLNSLGQLANLGFATNLIAMLLGFPAALLYMGSRRAKARHADVTAVQSPAAARDE